MTMRTIAIFLVLLAGASLVGSKADATIAITSGNALFLSGPVNPAVKYQTFVTNGSNQAHRVGEGALGSGQQSGAYVQWSFASDGNTFTFTFDGVQTVTSQFTGGSTSTISRVNSADPGSLNALQLRIRNTSTGTVELKNLAVNSESVGQNFSFTNSGVNEDYWTLSGFNTNLSSGFTITGTINLPSQGAYSSGNNSLIEISAGTAIPEPATLALLGLSLGVAGVGAGKKRKRQA